MVELDHRRRIDPQQHLVEPADLRPVGRLKARRARMQRGDRGLHRIGLRPAGYAQCVVHETQTRLDLRAIPERAVLLFQQHDVADRRRASGAARVVQQHQGQQALDPGPVRHQPVEQTTEPDGFDREIRPHQVCARGCDIAFGEDEIDDGEHAVEPLRQRVAFGHLIGNAGEPDLLLGADEALRHRLLTDEERARDLRGREAANGAQRQRDLDLLRERGMAAGEDQPQHVVVERRRRLVGRLRVELELMHERLLLAAEHGLPPDAINRLVAADIDEPGARIIGHLARRPAFERDREGILECVLGEIEIADEADQRGKHPPRLVAKDPSDVGRRDHL
ncbi:hypothetical protein ACVIHC_003343 [Bradyrhizobium diazoefficiens]